jgi:hypothetical protein
VNFEDARSAIYARMDTIMASAYPSTKIEYENREQIDLAQQTADFVRLELLFTDGEQASIGDNPITRYRGAIYISVAARKGTGTKSAFTKLSVLAKGFDMVQFSSIQTLAPIPMPGGDNKDWYRVSVRVPFYFDDMT